MAIMKRGRTWHLRRRVPRRYQSVDGREAVYLSLHTDSEMVARQKEPIVWQEQVNSWEALLAGETEDAEKRFAAAQNLARLRGLWYLPAVRVAELPREELLKRIELSKGRDGRADHREAAAILGGVAEPPISISRALELFWPLARDRIQGKSADQLRRWKNPRKKAIRNLINVIGDKPIADISRHDMLDFRDFWMERIESDGIDPGTANKDLTSVTGCPASSEFAHDQIAHRCGEGMVCSAGGVDAAFR